MVSKPHNLKISKNLEKLNERHMSSQRNKVACITESWVINVYLCKYLNIGMEIYIDI